VTREGQAARDGRAPRPRRRTTARGTSSPPIGIMVPTTKLMAIGSFTAGGI
jgi:hypothetical protein